MSKSDPCVNICVQDRGTGLCKGCGRTVDEILQWRRLPAARRATLLAELPQRLATLKPRKGRKGRRA
jgi:predicted Fe-S protein YdhL (DUF1289 family)